MKYVTLILKQLGTQTITGVYRFFAKKSCQSEITIVISMKNWSCVQNFGMIVYRESGFVQNGQNWIAPIFFSWIPGLSSFSKPLESHQSLRLDFRHRRCGPSLVNFETTDDETEVLTSQRHPLPQGMHSFPSTSRLRVGKLLPKPKQMLHKPTICSTKNPLGWFEGRLFERSR